MKIGDYVRTKGGLIGKVIEIKGNSKTYFIPNRQENDVIEVIKSSSNIIDLIEVGDYVNGCQITYIDEPSRFNSNRMLYFEEPEDYVLKTFINEDIKSIVTREMFESMKYKIGE